MNESIDIQIISQKREVKGAAIQGSSLISTFEEVRNLLQSGQPIFVNGHEYLTHATKLPSTWQAGCIELSSDYQHGTDYSASIEFEIYAKPKKHRKKGSTDNEKKSTNNNEYERSNGSSVERPKPNSGKKTKKVATPRSARLQPTSSAEPTEEPPLSGDKRSLSTNPRPTKMPSKNATDMSEILVKSNEKHPIPNAVSNPDGPPLKEDTEAESLKTLSTTEKSQSEKVDRHKGVLRDEEKVKHAQQLALRRTALRKKQLEEKAKAEKEKQEQFFRNKAERAEQLRIKLQNKALERLKEYEESKRLQEIEKNEEHFSMLEKQQASEELVHSEEYQKKVKQLRIDAKKRLKKFQDLEEKRRSEEEDKRQLLLLQHTSRVHAPLPSSTSTSAPSRKTENTLAQSSLLSTLSLFSNNWNQEKVPLHRGIDKVIYEETEEEVEIEGVNQKAPVDYGEQYNNISHQQSDDRNKARVDSMSSPAIAFTPAAPALTPSQNVSNEMYRLNFHTCDTPIRQESSRPGTAEEESVCEDNDSLLDAPVRTVSESSRLQPIDYDSSSDFGSDDETDGMNDAPAGNHFDFGGSTKNKHLQPFQKLSPSQAPAHSSNAYSKSKVSSSTSQKQRDRKNALDSTMQDNLSDLSDFEGFDLYDDQDSNFGSKQLKTPSTKLPPIVKTMNTNSTILSKNIIPVDNVPSRNVSISATSTVTTMIVTTQPMLRYNNDEDHNNDRNKKSARSTQKGLDEYEEKQYLGDSPLGGSVAKKKRKSFRKLPPIPIAPYNPLPTPLS